MKKLISALSVLLLGFMYSGCTENSPTQVSEDQNRAAIEDGSFVLGDVAALGKGRDKCTPWPECNKEGDNSSGVEYSVVVIPLDDDDLESFCPGFASNKLSAIWFTVDCDPPLTPFNYNPKVPPPDAPPDFTLFAGNGSIVIDVRKKTYRFWLWETTNRSDVYETGVQTYRESQFDEADDGVITLRIDDSHLMCRNKKRLVGCVGNVDFGDVVYTPIL